jgi:WD40 repeat protein
MRGHTSFVCFAVFSFDGNHIASGSGDKTVRLWEVISGNLLRTLKGHSKSVVAGAFSPTGDRIASASFDHTAQVWNTKTGEVVSIFNGHHEEVTAIVFSPTGVIVASASVDQKIQLWDPVVGILLAVFDMVGSPDYGFKELYFSPDQKFIISPFGCLNIGIEQMPIQNNLVSHELDQPAYYVTTDGWVHSTLTQQRKCWVPHEYRRHWASNVNTLVLGSTTGGVTILDMKALKCD